jgi:hypothetical protein
MSLWSILLMASDALAILCSLIFGVKFLRKGNWLLGLEWLVITVSTTNLMIFLFNESPTTFGFSFFLDQFSRAVGIPVITTVGLMAVTHRYKPPVVADVLMFAAGIVIGFLFAFTGFASAIKPYFLLVAWSAYSVYLIYFAKLLWDDGEKLQAINVMGAMLASQFIASIYDFYHIPGDDDLHTIFYTLALTAWAYSLAALYYAYVAMERHRVAA